MSYLYPYGDTQQLNLSWFLAKFKELYEYISNLDPDDIALDTVLSRFTNEYNSSTNYIPGDYVIHEGFIYKANQSTTGNFNPEAWDAALPVNDVQGLRILLGGLSEDLTELEQNAVTNTQYTPGAATADGLLRQTKNGTAETVMTVDKEPTANSQNPVKSGAVQAGIAAVSQAVGSERTDRQNADTSLQNQIDDLTDAANELKGSLNSILPLDTTPTSGSTKGVTSGGVRSAIDNISSLITATPLRTLNNVVAGARKNNRIVLINVAFQNPADGSVIANNNVPLFSGFPIPVTNAQGWHVAEVFGYVTDAPQDGSRSGKPIRFAINENGVLQTYWGTDIRLRESVSISAMYFS